MNDQEIKSWTEEQSTGGDTDTNGNDSEKDIDTREKESEDGPTVNGEMIVRIFDDETVTVSFTKLGLWTPGRLEKAMPQIFRECILARQAFGRKADGLPERFNTGDEDQTL